MIVTLIFLSIEMSYSQIVTNDLIDSRIDSIFSSVDKMMERHKLNMERHKLNMERHKLNIDSTLANIDKMMEIHKPNIDSTLASVDKMMAIHKLNIDSTLANIDKMMEIHKPNIDSALANIDKMMAIHKPNIDSALASVDKKIEMQKLKVDSVLMNITKNNLQQGTKGSIKELIKKYKSKAESYTIINRSMFNIFKSVSKKKNRNKLKAISKILTLEILVANNFIGKQIYKEINKILNKKNYEDIVYIEKKEKRVRISYEGKLDKEGIPLINNIVIITYDVDDNQYVLVNILSNGIKLDELEAISEYINIKGFDFSVINDD